MAPDVKRTVWHAFYDVLRAYDMRVMFGNPGSTEQPMLKNFPSDFEYILGLQEASVVAIADGYSQAMRKPAVVSLHTAAGTGNGMCNIMTAFMNKTPLILIAGQQTREMLIGDPFLANREPEMLPKPWVKWAYQPVRAIDIPAALIRAIATATTAPAGPVYLSIPLDDWDAPFGSAPVPRHVSTKIGPDPDMLATFADKIVKAKNFALLLGQEVDRSLAWDDAVKVAELLDAPVYQAPLAERMVFPPAHHLFKGALPIARGPLSEVLEGYDLILVVGAEIWRHYPWVAGPIVPEGTEVLHVTNDPHDAAAALVGDSIISDAQLALKSLGNLLETIHHKQRSVKPSNEESSKPKPPSSIAKKTEASVMSAHDAWSTLAAFKPKDALFVQESPSNAEEFVRAWLPDRPESYFTYASGGLGWAGPASVGIALAQKLTKSSRPTILGIGDGSFNYSVQSLYTAVQHKLKLIYLVPLNESYTILKEFAIIEETPNVPGLDLPGLNALAIAQAYGCAAYHAADTDELAKYFEQALKADGPVLIEFPIDKALRPLVPPIPARSVAS